MQRLSNLNKVIIILFIFLIPQVFFPQQIHAADPPAFVTIVHPIRNRNTWAVQTIDALKKQIAMTDIKHLPATYLLQYDTLHDQEIIDTLKHSSNINEVGLFLEVSENLATEAHVPYLIGNGDWARPDKVFFSGYTPSERKRMADTSIQTFQEKFGFIPHSIGAWYIDPQTLSYLHTTYGITASLICSDQYSTDKYHLWGQYWGVPFYPSQYNTLTPAQYTKTKLNVVMTQWALRDPFSAYGTGVDASTYSLQANDYHGEAHAFTTSYFTSLFSMYAYNPHNQFGQVTVGLEAGSDPSSTEELSRQIEFINGEFQQKKISVVTMSVFADWYQKTFPELSPAHTISNDLTDSSITHTVWYMSPTYRVNITEKNGQVDIRDLRRYRDEYLERDYLLADKRPVLYRTIPADIDSLVIHNTKHIASASSILEHVELLPDELRVDHKNLLSELPQRFLPTTLHLWYTPLLVSLERIQDNLALITTSRINGQRITGVQISPTDLIGIGIHPFKIGRFSYPFQTLAHFRHIPRLPFSRFFTSDSMKEAHMLPTQTTLVAREQQSLDSLAKKEASGSVRLFENSEFSGW
jgi:hypothetical protein